MLNPDSTNESFFTGFAPALSPLSQYQVGDGGGGNVCQTDGSTWGTAFTTTVPESACNTQPLPCGVHHYASLYSQGVLNSRPWNRWFGDPSLVVSTSVQAQRLVGSGYAWGYICPIFKDTSTGSTIEYCFEEWTYNFSNNTNGVVCGTGAGNNDQIVAPFGSSNYGTLYSGSPTFPFAPGQGATGWIAMAAQISPANLGYAIEQINSPSHCHRGISTDPADYELIGVEQGSEGAGTNLAAGGGARSTTLSTVYTFSNAPANTGAPSVPQPLSGTPVSANPGSWSNSPTTYAYQWNLCNSSGGSCSPISGATSATYTPLPSQVDNTLTVTVVAGNQPDSHSNYAYSAPITSAASPVIQGNGPSLVTANGTIWAASQDVNNALYLTGANFSLGGGWQSALLGAGSGTTYSAPSAVTGSGGEVWVAAEGPGHQLWVGVEQSSGSWSPSNDGSGGENTYSAPSAVFDSGGDLLVFAEGKNNSLVVTEYVKGTGWVAAKTLVSGGVFSAPSAVAGPGGEVWVAYEGAGGKVVDGVDSAGKWTSSYESAEALDAAGTAPSEVIDSSGNVWVFFEGVNHALRLVERNKTTGWGTVQALLGENSIYSAPSAVAVSGGEKWVAFEGPKNELWDGFDPTSGVWNTNYQGPEGSSYSAPSEMIDSAGEVWAATQGANNNLDIKVRLKPSGEWVGTYEGVVGVAPSDTALPSVTGEQPAVGVGVGSSVGSWTGTPSIAYSYQWNACAGSSCSAISGATASSYIPTSTYVGDTLTVTVTGTNSFGHASATSAKSAPVLSTPASVVSAPSLVAANGAVDAATEGSTNALFLTSYNPGLGGGWQSALLGAGSGTTYSAPSAVTGSGGEVWVAAEGPGHQLWVGVEQSSGSWSPSNDGSGGENTYSAPSAVFDSGGDLLVFAEGKNNSLVVTEYVKGTGWVAAKTLVSGGVFSAPSAVAGPGGEVWVAYEGAGGKVVDGVDSAGKWTSSYESAEALDAAGTAPSEVIDSSGNVWVFFEGVNHALRLVERNKTTGWGTVQALLGENSIYSAPSAVAVSGGEKWVAFEGPKNELWDGFDPTSGVWNTNYQGPEGSSYSAPSEMIDSAGEVWAATQGANNNLDIKVRLKPSGEWVGTYEGG
jgi:hypothetical protein